MLEDTFLFILWAKVWFHPSQICDWLYNLIYKSEIVPVARSFQFKLTEQKIIRNKGTERFLCKDLQLFTYLKTDVKNSVHCHGFSSCRKQI